MKNKQLVFLAAVLAFFLFIPSVLADGAIFIPYYDQHVYIPEQKAAIFWDGQTETITLSTKARPEELVDMAWIIPVPSSTDPEVEEGDIQIFYDLAELFRPKPEYSRGFGIMATESIQGVEIIEAKTVDIYNIVILKATSAQAMVDWLNNHDFAVPQDSVPLLQYYADQENFYFIANQINLGAKYTDVASGEDIECADLIYEEIEDHIEYLDEDEIGYRVEYIMDEKEVCFNASPSRVNDLVNLKSGVSTPLKITITPEEPFYPMWISSMNEGSTNINVYVFSEKPVEDQYSMLSQSQMTKVPEYMKEDYDLTNQKYVTYLTYNGPLSALNQDSVFVQARYKSNLDLDYSASDTLLYIGIGAAIFVIFLIILILHVTNK